MGEPYSMGGPSKLYKLPDERMKELSDRWAKLSNDLKGLIKEKGRVLEHGVLDVSRILNHYVRVDIVENASEIIAEGYRIKHGEGFIDEIITVESSGIPFATCLARNLNTNLIFARKGEPVTFSGKEIYSSKVESFTKGKYYDIVALKDVLKKGKKYLIADDFLARGEASRGVLKLLKEADAQVAGFAILITKDIQNQNGWKYLNNTIKKEDYSISLNSLLRITRWPGYAKSIDDLVFAEPQFEIK